MENTSGQGKNAVVPPEIKGWNWGAFLLNVVWGIGNDTYIALLMLVPPLFLVMPFVLGGKGNKWAWQNRRWNDVAHFKRVQRGWAKWGVVVVVAYFGFFAAFGLGFYLLFPTSEAYVMSVARLQASPQAISVLGEPVTPGFPFGSVETNGPSGKAALSFSAQGPKANGTVIVRATKANGTWRLELLELEVPGRPGRIKLD
jgi:hypothetical protein